MEFKHLRLIAEFDRVKKRLQIIVYALDAYVKHRYKKEIMVTSIFRTQEEQDEIYGHLAGYKESPWKSVHQYWRGVDVRLSNFSKEEIKDILMFLNKSFEYTGRYETAIKHDIGYGSHIHIQVDMDGVTNIRDDDY